MLCLFAIISLWSRIIAALKVPCWEGEWKCDVYNSTTQTKVEGDLSTVVCGRLEARAIIQCTGLWFAGSKFGASWKLVQME